MAGGNVEVSMPSSGAGVSSIFGTVTKVSKGLIGWGVGATGWLCDGGGPPIEALEAPRDMGVYSVVNDGPEVSASESVNKRYHRIA